MPSLSPRNRAPRGRPALAFSEPGLRARHAIPLGAAGTPRVSAAPSLPVPLGAAPPSDLASSVRNAMRTKGSVFLAIVAGVAFAHGAVAADLGSAPRRAIHEESVPYG